MGNFWLGRILRVTSVGTVLIGFLSIAALPLLALTDVVIPIDQVVRGQSGEEHLLVEVPLDEDMFGLSCPVHAVSDNQESVHPDSDLIIRSGASEVVLEDVESEAFVHITAEGNLTLAETVSVWVRLGPDRVFSGGLTVTIACSAATTTTEVSGTSVTNQPSTTGGTGPSTTAPATTTSTGDVVGTSVATTTETVGGIVVTNPNNPQVPSTLPFTGVSESSLAILALVVTGIGGFALVATRRTEDRTAPRSWSS